MGAYFNIWDMKRQKLFTELKKLFFGAENDLKMTKIGQNWPSPLKTFPELFGP